MKSQFFRNGFDDDCCTSGVLEFPCLFKHLCDGRVNMKGKVFRRFQLVISLDYRAKGGIYSKP